MVQDSADHASHGRLLGLEEMKLAMKHDSSAFAPTVQFHHQRELEPPGLAEGFSRIDILPFKAGAIQR